MTDFPTDAIVPDTHVRLQDGIWHIDAATPLAHYPPRLTDCLVAGARAHPDRTFMAQRDGAGNWEHLTYAQALDSARSIGQALRERGLSCERPLVILSGNDLQHAQLALGAMYAGVPYAPLSPAYSLSADATRLRQMLAHLTPGAVYATDGAAYATALEEAAPNDCERITGAGFAALLATPPGAIDSVHATLNGDTIAKFLFTSGSSGQAGPKAVITTQRMLCSNQQMLRQTFPDLATTPPVLVDWLPWSHTFGGSHNVGIALYNGGTYYIDSGKPAPGAFDATLANLRDVAPTLHFNVPRGWDMLASALEEDAALRARFFARNTLLFCAGAALSPSVWQRLAALAPTIRIMSGLGMTESAPGCLFGTGDVLDAGYVGVPAPGCRVKLVPAHGKLEAYFAGPHVTPGYWRDAGRTRAAFDGAWLRTGDALRFADPAIPARGFLFDGRLAEDFKLDSGTWVSAGTLRARIVALGAPYVLDAVIAGSGRAEVAVLVFPRLDACARLDGLPPDASAAQVLASDRVIAHMAATLAGANSAVHGSAACIGRLLVLDGAPEAARGEVTDKGSINHAAVLANRAQLVAALYDDRAPGALIVNAANAANA